MDHVQSAVHANPARQNGRCESERVEELLARCARHDGRALAELYTLVAAQLFGVLLRMLKNSVLAEEALQDVMVSVWQPADPFVAHGGRSMTWLMSVTRYRAIDLLHVRRERITLDEALENSTRRGCAV
jgi:DNA-directed RNA polymerase specialized sigma24 family protein